VALLSGLAGSVVVCRGGAGGGITALPGVAIAVALMPPLCTVGLGVGSGLDWPIVTGAGLLFVTNLAAIVSSAFTVFFLVRMDAPDVRTRIDQYIQERASGDRLFPLLRRTPLRALLGDIGKLRWRIIMVALALGAVFVPLRNALVQVAREAVARSAIQDAVKRLVPADALVSQQVRLNPEHIFIRLIATERVDAARAADVRETLARHTGRIVGLAVREVASKRELAELLDRVPAAVPQPAPEPALDTLRADLVARVGVPLAELWPAGVTLAGWEVGFSREATVPRMPARPGTCSRRSPPESSRGPYGNGWTRRS